MAQINLPLGADKATRMALQKLSAKLTGNLTANRLLYYDDGNILSVDPLTNWIAGVADEIDVTDDGDGTVTIGIVNPLIVGKGGTGAATLTDHGILVGSGTSAVTALGVATNGQLPIGSTGADPVLATISEGEGIDITNGAGTISIAGEDASKTNKGICSFSEGEGIDITASSGDITIAGEDASTTNKGIASFNSTNFSVASGAVNTIQNINTGASPTFAGLDLTGITDGNVPYISASGFADSPIKTDGTNVGIGITPTQTLHAYNTTDNAAVCIGLLQNNPGYTNVADNDVAYLQFIQKTDFAHASTGTVQSRIGQILLDATHASRQSGLVFYTENAGSLLERMRVDHNGLGAGASATPSNNVPFNFVAPVRTATAATNNFAMWLAKASATGLTIPAGTTSLVGSFNIDEPGITNNGTITTAFTMRISGAPTEGTNNYALLVDSGNSRFDGHIGIGNSVSGSDDVPFKFQPAPRTATASTNTFGAWFSLGEGVTVPSGTSNLVGSMNIDEPAITNNGTINTAFTVRISGAPTEGTKNYALWVDDGLAQFDDYVGFGTELAPSADQCVTYSYPARIATASTNNFFCRYAPSGVTIPAGTTALVGTLNIDEPVISATGTVTNAFTVRISGAPTEGATNHALWVVSGRTTLGGNLFVQTIKSGATQGGAGAAAGELWKTASHATLPDNVVMIGV